ncbi:MAG: endonuclease MutS2 [Bradymonadaceae bacterium]
MTDTDQPLPADHPAIVDREDRPEPSDDSYPLETLVAHTLAPLDADRESPVDFAPLPEKSREDLGWQKVLDLVENHAATPEGEELLPNLPPLPDRSAVERRLHEVREAMWMVEEDERPPLHGLRDVRQALAHVAKDGTLVAEDLQAIARNCDVAARCKKFLDNRSEAYPYLRAVTANVAPCDDLRTRLNDAIEPGGRLSDSASPDIADLRREVQNQHDRLKAKIQEMLRSRHLEDHLQDDYYTIRDDRYVLPVRATSKSEVPGIVHGYSSSGETAFIEPRELVDVNNQLRWAEIELEEEKERILERLSGLVADCAEPLQRNIELLTYLDVVIAAGAYGRETLDGSIATPSESGLELRDARHPLLWVQNEREVDGETVNDTVTNDVHLDPEDRVLVISGPNTGGKTVLLKAIGLASLSTRCGLPIAAEPGSEVPLFDVTYTDIGDEQSIERDLSSFSAHLTNINGFLDDCEPGTLVLLDELFTGTDPMEGAALATALLEELAERGATVGVTTHLEGIKTLGLQRETFANVSMGFDLEALEPTYRVTHGVPGSSFAIRIADRLGFPKRLVERATEVVEGEDEHGVEEVIESLEDEMAELREERERLERERRKAEKQKETFREKYEEVRDRERDLVHDEAREVKEELVEAREEIREKLAELRERREAARSGEPDEGDLHEMQEELADLESNVEQARDRTRPPETGPEGLARVPADELEEGMEVYVGTYDREGTVVRFDADGDEARVQIGALKAEVAPDDLYYPNEEERRADLRGRRQRNDSGHDQHTGTGSGTAAIPRAEANTVDLRGLRADEAVDRLENFLDEKFMESLEGVFIIHGHGTGTLRRAVRSYLTESPYVDDFRKGDRDEGGDGVTVARFVDEIH